MKEWASYLTVLEALIFSGIVALFIWRWQLSYSSASAGDLHRWLRVVFVVRARTKLFAAAAGAGDPRRSGVVGVSDVVASLGARGAGILFVRATTGDVVTRVVKWSDGSGQA